MKRKKKRFFNSERTLVVPNLGETATVKTFEPTALESVLFAARSSPLYMHSDSTLEAAFRRGYCCTEFNDSMDLTREGSKWREEDI